MNFEDELHRTLARKSAPDGFADRVLARIATPRHRTSALTLRRIAALGGLTAHQIIEHRRLEEGERARRQLMTALHIASAKMRVAQRAVVHD
jgi:AraC-like DNA-binding protein